MVGIFSRFSGYMRPHPAFLDKKENQVPQRDGGCEMDFCDDLEREENNVVEFDIDFKPIQHPLEPIDEDRPAKCPIPNSSFLNDEGIWKELFAESLLKKAELSLLANEKGTTEQPPTQEVHKRHHTLGRDPAVPLFRSPQNSIFQVFHQCKDFEP